MTHEGGEESLFNRKLFKQSIPDTYKHVRATAVYVPPPVCCVPLGRRRQLFSPPLHPIYLFTFFAVAGLWTMMCPPASPGFLPARGSVQNRRRERDEMITVQ